MLHGSIGLLEPHQAQAEGHLASRGVVGPGEILHHSLIRLCGVGEPLGLAEGVGFFERLPAGVLVVGQMGDGGLGCGDERLDGGGRKLDLGGVLEE